MDIVEVVAPVGVELTVENDEVVEPVGIMDWRNGLVPAVGDATMEPPVKDGCGCCCCWNVATLD